MIHNNNIEVSCTFKYCRELFKHNDLVNFGLLNAIVFSTPMSFNLIELFETITEYLTPLEHPSYCAQLITILKF